VFILEEPYVSDFLLASVVRLGAPVLRTPTAERLLHPRLAPLLHDDDAFAAAARLPGARV